MKRLFFLLLFLPLLAHAATYYVTQNGAGTHVGSVTNPWSASDFNTFTNWSPMIGTEGKISPDDTVILRGPFTSTLSPQGSGTSGHNITIKGEDPTLTTFSAGGFNVARSYLVFSDFYISAFRPFVLTGSTNLTIERVTFFRPGTAIEFGGATDCVVQNCDFTRWLSNGCINLSGTNNLLQSCIFHDGTEGTDVFRANGAINCTVSQCTFIRLVTPNNDSGTSTDSVTTGLGTKNFTTQTGKTWEAGDYFEASYTLDTSHRMTGTLMSYDSGTGALVMDVSSVAGGSGLTYANWTLQWVNAGNHSDIFQAFGGTSTQSHDNLVERCWIEDNSGQFGNFEGDSNPSGIRDWTFRNNVFVNSRIQTNVFEGVTGFKFYNNTVYNASGNAGFGSDDAVECYNNIFCRVGTINAGGPYNYATRTKDYNFMSMYATDAIKTGYVYNGTTQLNEQHGINTGTWDPDEVFVDAANKDFTLRVGSPAIGAGVDLSSSGFTNDYTGATRTAPWDMGAYKYTGAGTVPVITTNPVSQSVTTGANVFFTAAATGTPTPTWQWQKDGSDITGATSATYSITGVVLGDAGTYTAIATNTAGSTTSTGAVLAVGVIPPTAPSTPATPIISIF